MGLLVAGISMETRRDQDGSVGSNRMALFPYSEFRQDAAKALGLQSVESERKGAIDIKGHEFHG